MTESIEAIRAVAAGLGPLAEDVAFLGGAVVPLLVTDPGAPRPRPTRDVDLVIEVVSRAEYSTQLREKLLARGFLEDDEAGAPLCRWVFNGLKVDIMPTDGDVLHLPSRWFPAALLSRFAFSVPGGGTIGLVSAPCFLATKLEAFADGGQGDFASSHDLEDIISVVDGRPSLEREMRDADANVRSFIEERLTAFLADPRFLEALAG